jgi:hypothetical protein
MSEKEIYVSTDVESNGPIAANVYWQFLITMVIAIVFEGLAIAAGSMLFSLLGQFLLIYAYRFLFPGRYRIGIGIFFVTWLVFFLLIYFGCPSLPVPFCRAKTGLDWLNRLSEGAHFTNFALALVLTAFIIKSLLSVKSAQDA